MNIEIKNTEKRQAPRRLGRDSNKKFIKICLPVALSKKEVDYSETRARKLYILAFTQQFP